MVERFKQVTEPLEDCPVAEAIAIFDEEPRIVVVQVRGEDLGTVANAATEPWLVQDVYDRPGRVRHLESEFPLPFGLEPPRHCGGWYMSDEILVIKKDHCRTSNSLARLQHRGAKQLFRQRPVAGSRPSREVAGRPDGCGHGQRIFRPSCGIARIERDRDIQATPRPSEPALRCPTGKPLGRVLGVDTQLGGDIGGPNEPLPVSKDCGQLRATSRADAGRLRYRHTNNSRPVRCVGLILSDIETPVTLAECELVACGYPHQEAAPPPYPKMAWTAAAAWASMPRVTCA